MQKSRTFNSLVVHGVLMVFLLSATGCQVPAVSDDFERLGLGSPLPAELPAGMERTVLGAGFIGSINPENQSMTNADMQIINALTDEAGNVVARSYLAVKISHCILFIAGSYTYVIELDVPTEAFRNRLGKRKVPDELISLQAQPASIMWMRSLLERSQPEKDGEKPELPVTFAKVKREVNISLLAMKKTRETAEKSSGGPLEIIFDFEASVEKLGRALAAGVEVEKQLRSLPENEPVTYPLDNVSEALLYYRILLNGTMPSESADEKCPASPLMSMYAKWIQPRVMELLTDRGAFAGVTEAGYDKSISTLDGMNLRVRNLGGRRVRVEISGTLIRDPIIAMLMLLN